jgi:hypothetical protein
LDGYFGWLVEDSQADKSRELFLNVVRPVLVYFVSLKPRSARFGHFLPKTGWSEITFGKALSFAKGADSANLLPDGEDERP